MKPARTDILIVGAGLAGARTAESLRALGYDGQVMVAGSEPHRPYERPALSKKFLLGRRTLADLALRPDRFWEDHAIDLRPAATVQSIDVTARRALVGGHPVRWRQLVVATGVAARRLPALERLAGVHYLRTVEDASSLRAALAPGVRLAIVGAGFIGLEVASSASARGVQVTVVDVAAAPFSTTLGSAVGARMAGFARAAEVRLLLGQSIRRALRAGERLAGLELADGTCLPCDLALIGVGTRPRVELLDGQLPLAADGGLQVDLHGRSAAPQVLACGDVASRPVDGRTEHWSAAAAGGRMVAHALIRRPVSAAGHAYFWSDQFGHRLQVVGHTRGAHEQDLQVAENGSFVARYFDAGGRLQAVALLDRPDLLPVARVELTTYAPNDLVAA